jgi:putative flavoprotein involved in K+ transport
MEHWDTIVIGGGQAGLAAGYYLKKMKKKFIILDAGGQVGDAWRRRWDSLRLFTPARLNGLPGMPFPGKPGYFPTRDEVADYLWIYEKKFDLPVRCNCKVLYVIRGEGKFEVGTREGVLSADNIIVATGSYQQPKIPAIAQQIDPMVHQIHSLAYRCSEDLPAGDVLVIGAGTSGVQIALDVRGDRGDQRDVPGDRDQRQVYLAGEPTARIPDFVFRYFERPFVWIASHILTVNTRAGRKVRKAIKEEGKGAPLIGVSMEDVYAAGIRHVSRITGVRDGRPMTETGVSLPVSAIIWATGFLPDYSWIRIPGCIDGQGYPLTQRGVSPAIDGLYFVGSTFQFGLTSTWLAGVGRDARYVCGALAARKRD